MERPSRFFSLLAGVLFLAVCAWLGAFFYSRAETPKTAVIQYADATDSAKLRGIAVRSEQQLCFDRGMSPTAEDGLRVAAGEVLAASADGSRLCCDSSSVFFSQSDGYEFLSPDMLSDLTVSSLSKLLASRPQTKRDSATLVADYVWYYAALTADSDALPREGDCRVLFEGFDQPVSARILLLSAPENGQRALLLRLTVGGDYLRLRKCGAQLIFSEYLGLKVPLEALHSADDGGKFVYTLTAGQTESQAVDIIYQGTDFALVSAQSGLQEGSRVLLS